MLIYRLWRPARHLLPGMVESPHVEKGSLVWISNGWGEDIRAEVVVKSSTEIGVHTVKGQVGLHWFKLAEHGINWRVDSVLGKTFVVVEPKGKSGHG